MATNKIQYTLAFTADTTKAKQQLNDLKNQLTNVVNTVATNQFGLGFTKEIQQASAAAIQLKTQLQNATNVNTGRLDLSKFNHSLKQSGRTLDSYRIQLSKLGPEGQQAFKNLAIAITNSERPIFSLTKSMKKLGESFANTMRWMITTSALTAVTSSIRNAYTYAKDLNKSLNDIRIVTGQSSDEMAKFAERANKAAKSLSASTLAYTKASLIYYQQGLSDSEVEARTDTTIKMSNVTGESADQVSSYMTAIWNNFAEGSQNLDYFADVITALGAATAASSEEIANGLEKFAAIGDTVGLSYEYATAALTTIIDKTRQSEDVVGNALKTIFARIQGLQQGETQDDGVTLNKYSKALENVGIQIIESNGELKEMDSILDELGEKWSTLGNAEKVALAQTVGGVRQYSQLISLMDNWDSFKENVNIAESSAGSLQKQQDIYAESWEAASKRVKASMEGLWDELISDDFFIGLTNGLATLLDAIKKITQALGGAQGVLLGLASAFIGIYQGKLTAIFTDMGVKISTLLGRNKDELNGLQAAAERFLQLNLTGEDATVFEIRKRMTQDYVNALKDANAEEKIMINQLMEQNELIANNAAKTAKNAKDLSRSAERSALAPARYQAHVAAENAKMEDDLAKTRASAAAQEAASKFDKRVNQGWETHLGRQVKKWEKAGIENLDEVKEKYRKQYQKEWMEEKFNYTQKRQGIVDKTYNELYTPQGNVYEKTFNENFAPKQEAYNNLKKAEEAQTVVGSLFTKENQQYDKAAIEAMRKNFTDLSQKDGGKYLTNLIGKEGTDELDDFIKKLDELEKKQKELKDLESQKKEGEKNPKLDEEIAQKQKEIDAKQKEVNGLDNGITKRLADGVSNADMDARKFFDEEQINKIRQAGTAIGENVVQTQNLKNAADGARDAMGGLASRVDKTAKSITTGLQGATSIASGLSSLMSIGDTWDMESDMSVLERLLKTITTAGFAIPMISNGVINLGKAFADGSMEVTGFGSAFGVLWGKLKAFIFSPTTLVIGGIIAAITALGYAIYREATKTERALKEANKELEETKKAANEASSAYEGLKSSIESLESSKNTLSGLTKGTIEWKEAVFKLNQEVLNLIDKYPELAQYLTSNDGVLGFDEEGIDKLLESQMKESEALQAALFNKQINKIKASQNVKDDKLGNDNDIAYQKKIYITDTTDPSAEGSEQKKYASWEESSLDSEIVNKIYREALNIDAIKTNSETNELEIDFEKFLKDGDGELKQYLEDQSELWNELNKKLPKFVEGYGEMQASEKEIDAINRSSAENYVAQHSDEINASLHDAFASGMAQLLDENRKIAEEQYKDIKNNEDKLIEEYSKITGLSTDAIKEKIDEEILTSKNIYDAIVEQSAQESAASQVKDKLDEYGISDTAITNPFFEGSKKDILKSKFIASRASDEFLTTLTEEERALLESILTEDTAFYDQVNKDTDYFGENRADFALETIQRSNYEKTSLNNRLYISDSNQSERADATIKSEELNSEEIDDYAKLLQKNNKNLEQYDGIAKNVAATHARMNKGLDALQESFEDNSKILKSANKNSKEYSDALNDMRDAVADVLNAEEDMLSDKFILSHMEDIEKAANGDVDAIERLRSAAAADIILQVTGESDMSQVDSEIQNLHDKISNFALETDLTITPHVDNKEFLENCNELLRNANFTTDQAAEYFERLGYDVELNVVEVPASTTKRTQSYKNWLMPDGTVRDGVVGEETTTTWAQRAVGIKTMTYKGSAGGGVNFTNTTAGGASTSKSGGSGGSQKENKKSSDEIERYHKTNKTLESLQKNLDDISKAKDKAFGKSKIDLIDQEIEKYDELIESQKGYIKEIEKNLSKDRGVVEAYGAKIDENGVITNYEELMQQALDKYNNSGKTEADEEAYNNFKESISQYEETLQLWMDENSELTDMISEKLSKKLEKVQYKLELKLDISQSDMEYVEYMLSRIEDKAFSAAEAISLLGENTEELINQGKAYEESIKGALEAEGVSEENISKILNGQMKAEDMAALGLSAETIEIIKNGQKGLLDVNKQLLENQKSVWEQINVVVEETVEAFNKQAEAISHASSVLSHYRNIVELVGQENLGVSNAMMDAAADANINNAMASLTNSKAQLETLQDQRKQVESKLAVGNLTKDEEKYLKDSLENIDEQIQNAEEKMLSDWENVLEQASQEFENAVTRTIKSFEKAMSGTFGNFERLQDAFNKQKELGDMYLDDYKKIYELSKLTRDINKSLETTDNIKGKEILRDLQQEINTLEAQGVKLSEYDVQNLRAKYDLRLAEIALEEAQNAKTQVRMTRNSEGNWSYVYTADENKMAEAEQNYEDKLYAMQELNANYIENLQSMILTAMTNMSNELAQLNPAEMTDEQYKSEQERITSHYMDQISIYRDQMNNALGNSEQTYDFWGAYSEKTGYAISANEAWVDNFEETQLSILTGFESLEEFHQNFVDSVGAPGVKGSLLGDLTGAYDNWSSRVSLAMQAAGTSMDGFKTKFGQVIGETNRQAEKSVKEAEKLKDKYVEYMGDTTTAVVNWRKDHLEYLEEEIKKNEQLYKTLGDLIEAYTTYSSLPPKKDNTPPGGSGGGRTPGGNKGGNPNYGTKNAWTEVDELSEEYTLGYNDGKTDKTYNRMRSYNEKYKTCVSYTAGYDKGYDSTTAKYNLTNKYGYQYTSDDDPSRAASAATGMYTGSWGSSGKLAILHEKELVLNKKDTENILKSVDMVHNISNMIDLNASLMSNRQQLFSAIGGHIGGGEIMQNITINADFPNAQDQNEIKAAFDNLLNKASQYINRKR